jgi:quinoprotein dehydrogenase-associated probable ABC transporter substrate-binding protein
MNPISHIMRILFPRNFLAALVLFLFTAAVHGAEDKAFRVCADPINPPFSERDGGGFENRIAELFAKELHQKVEYTWFPQRMGFVRNTLKAKKEDDEQTWKCDVVMGVPSGWEQVATTKPYYTSTYALVYNRRATGLESLKEAGDLLTLPPETLAGLHIAMFDQSSGTDWLFKYGLTQQAIPYQSMTGDASVNTAMTMLADFKSGKLDVAILWGPIAAYVAQHAPKGAVGLLPMRNEADVRFEFPISMGVRQPDAERKRQLDELIDKNAARIAAILKQYGVPVASGGGIPASLP